MYFTEWKLSPEQEWLKSKYLIHSKKKEMHMQTHSLLGTVIKTWINSLMLTYS